ncbi:hypothetical protein ABL78_7755 [Leptomonas seymouri]|uniref:Uncharacterized protein n=1 Tax=Leptomonas seymouri TaxID=5684 RepID=A0A0N0P2Q0_LEPSE|nr:hypothetical protein ABL78_7755 [Leptomonas seymouri]|eukprot:KPI83216.1 hypothetical protein ABL78_7755 [Leptomonas seymouri]
MSHTAADTREPQRRQLLQLLRDEASLQQQLHEQRWLLQRVSEASVSLFVWWRNGAAAAASMAAAAATQAVPPDEVEGRENNGGTDDLHRHPLHSLPGMLFYSLGELLRLVAAPTPNDYLPRCASAAVSHTANSSSDAVPTGEPSCKSPPWTLVSMVLQRAHVALPTPALLIRHRLLDPSPTALPPTHAMLLGSVSSTEFPVLFKWLHHLTLECEEALHRLRPDQRQPSEISTDFTDVLASTAMSPESSQARLINEQEMLSSPHSQQITTCAERTSIRQIPPCRAATKRSRDTGNDDVGTQTAVTDNTESSTGAWDPLPWSSLCASLHRLLSFFCELSKAPSTPIDEAASAMTCEACWSVWASNSHNRAQHRFLLATLCGMHAALQDLLYWHLTQDPCPACSRGNLQFPSRRQKVDLRYPASSLPQTPQLTTAPPLAASEAQSNAEGVAVASVGDVEKLTQLTATVTRQLAWRLTASASE